MSTGGLYVGAPGSIGPAIAREDRNRLIEQEKQKGAMQAADLMELAKRAAQGNPNFLGPRTLEGQIFGRQGMDANDLFARANPEAAAQLAMQKLGMGTPRAPIVAKPGEVILDPNNNYAQLAAVPTLPDFQRAGTTRQFQRGGVTVTQEADGQGGWKDLATAPAWKPDAPKDPKDTFGDEAKLRGEFDTKTKDFATTRDAYSRIVNVASNPSPAGDISLIFGFMKMNDPNSTVREGEYATAQNAGSVPQRVVGIYNKVLSGESLTPAQRADFVAQAGRLYGSQVGSFSQDYKRYADLAQKYNFSPDKVVYDRTAGLPAAMPAPQAAGTAQAAPTPTTPRATNPITGEVVEWNGTEWAKVK